MAKRKASALQDEGAAAPPPRRSTRQRTSAASSTAAEQSAVKPAVKKGTSTEGKKGNNAKPAAAAKPKAVAEEKENVEKTAAPKVEPSTNGAATARESEGERQYWLLKAEPESRFENGVDVKFSIDDLAARTAPEPWDGIRAYAARNNLRAMKKGDLAFFYHSNCKEPGIVGIMEIVQEHSPDLSAHDPKAPYYDPKSKPSDPKWSVVHVRFRSKFPAQIGLKELREMGAGAGRPLENMQMLKQSRLSVSKVSAAEWEYLNKVVEERAAKQ